MFTEDLEKAKTPLGKIQKVETFINSLNKTEIIDFSKKILKQKMELDQGATKLQEVSARSVLSRKYGNAKIATHELQAVMRRGTPANKYQDLLNATIRQENSFATRVQTQFRSHLARQELERRVMYGGVLPSGFGTPVGESHIFDPSTPFNQADFDAFFVD